MQWHIGKVSKWDRPLGVTDFTNLSITLRADLTEQQLRCTLTHELVHLERGPTNYTGLSTPREEEKVHLVASQRLVDPVLFELLAKDSDDRAFSGPARIRLLGVDLRTLKVWAKWRAGVQMKTALARFEQFHPEQPPQRPAPWIERYRASHPWVEAAFEEEAAAQ